MSPLSLPNSSYETSTKARKRCVRPLSFLPLTHQGAMQSIRPLRNACDDVMTSMSLLWPPHLMRNMRRSTCLHLLILPVILLLIIEMGPFTFLQRPKYSKPGLSTKSEGSSTNPLTPPATSSLPAEGFPFPRFVMPGISIVACCMNRHATLRKTLQSWQDVGNVSEIVVVDWSSDPPLRRLISELGADIDPRVRVLRVENETSWVLTRAYNLGIVATSYDTIIRTDCDYSLAADFVDVHPLNETVFYAGNYAYARDENEAHLNGAVYVSRKNFLDIGGYDERIQTYGWDDEELYARLQRVGGLQKLNLSYDHVTHVPHDDKERAQRDVTFVHVEIDLNSLLLEQLGVWNISLLAKNQWSTVQTEDRFAQLRAGHKPPPLRQLVSQQQFNEAWDLALGRRLANDYAMPWEIMSTMSMSTKELLLTKLIKRSESTQSDKPARMLFVHCMHGLGNRLRAMGSALAFADSTGREPVVIWEKDAHLSANFHDLFANDDMVVMDQFKPKWPLTGYEKWNKAWSQFNFYNYMEMEKGGAIKGQIIINNPDHHIYFKSAYIMEVRNARLTNWEKANKYLRMLKPVESVLSLVRLQESRGLADMVGVHIRNRTLDADIQNVDFDAEYGSQASKEMEYWRLKSSYYNFVEEMRRIVAKNDTVKFYVSTDTAELLTVVGKEFGDRVHYTARACDNRDAECVQFALVDLLCLAKTKLLIGSTWSSFTEAASRLGGKAPKLSGKDFASHNQQAFS